MSLKIEIVPEHEKLSLLPLLLEADEGEERIHTTLLNPSNTAYAARLNAQIVGAAVMHWEKQDASEILYIEISTTMRGLGYGKQMIHALQDELPTQGGNLLLVGTANSSLENIAFYQKCGFRMYTIKHDYFSYIQPPIQENGIPLRDMLVFSYKQEE